MISTNSLWGTDTDHGNKVGRLWFFYFLLNMLGKTTSQIYKQFPLYVPSNWPLRVKKVTLKEHWKNANNLFTSESNRQVQSVLDTERKQEFTNFKHECF